MLLFGILIMTWPWYQFVFKRFSFFDAKKKFLVLNAQYILYSVLEGKNNPY